MFQRSEHPVSGVYLVFQSGKCLRLIASLAFFEMLYVFSGASILAQESRPSSGSPLDTILHTRLWADVPEAQDFVKQSRPADGSLDYQPLTRPGSDPVRPKPKSAAELDSLQAELEKSRDANARRAGLKPFKTELPLKIHPKTE